ncbi:MAG: PRC-barrel domain-containing protein [Eubacteriales bacterium]|nr:PRC-barrel domain-containing protein [Eubacteriales bacterium]
MNVKRLSGYIGAAVVDTADGRIKGFIKDCVSAEDRLEGIVVQKNGVLRKEEFLPYRAVESFGDYEVRADFSSAVPVGRRELHPVYNAEIGVIGANGERIGRVSDICFDARDGRLVGLEINRGIFHDVSRGRSMVEKFMMRRDGDGEYYAVSEEGGVDS